MAVLVLASSLLVPIDDVAARVNPLTTIARQIQKPNMLILLDTSSSMGNLSGERDFDWAEAGVDCDKGDAYCRTVGYPGRCYYTATGRMGPGIHKDFLPCDADSQCTGSGYCRDGAGVVTPEGCKQDSDCDSGYCKGTCSHLRSKTCNKNSDCGSGNECEGVCVASLTGAIACTSDAQCPTSNPCHRHPRNFCAGAGLQQRVKMCQIAQTMCRLDSDCAGTPGDTCGPATSRIVIAKRVLNNVVQDFNKSVNFGFMTFTNTGYFPYKAVKSGTEANQTFNVFLSREQLEMANCFSRTTGPVSPCSIMSVSHTIKPTLNSRYRLNSGTHFTTQDASWNTAANCKLECEIAGVGTGIYEGSYYSYVEKNAQPNVSDDSNGDGHADIHDEDEIDQTTDYPSKVRSIGSGRFVYIEAPTNRRNVGGVFGNRFEEFFKQVGSPCGTSDGMAFWDSARVRFMDTSAALPTANAVGMADDIGRKLRKASFGGIYPVGGTPSGRALKSDQYLTEYCSAYHYIEKVKTQNTAAGVGCRENFILFITDGYPGGDTNCNHADCGTTPLGPACNCRTILSARDNFARGTKVQVVGFSNATTTGVDRDVLNNIAKAGGTEEALFAVREEELQDAITTAIYRSIRNSYATSPLTVGASATPNTMSTMVLDSRADFPEWRGHLIAYDTSVTPALLKWDAAAGFDATANPSFWTNRNVWTHDAAGLPLKITMDAAGNVPDAARLRLAGLGVTDAEAVLVARWLLGDPAMKNPAVFGAVVNSTPTEVALPDGSLTYVGSSDGMLHAFHSRAQTIGGQPYLAGREAFAYIPRDMLKVIRRLFAQGGQMAPPSEHVFGLANSPKVKKLCVSNCAGSGTPVMSTVLVMPEGVGGNELFALDVGAPFGPSGVKNTAADPPVRLLWHSEYKTVGMGQSDFNTALGQTISLPGFYYAKTAGRDEYRLLAASGYSDVASTTQGLTLVNARASTGEVISTTSVRNQGAGCGLASTEPTSPTVLSDIGIARRHQSDDQDRIAAAYVGDTWGNLFRYVPNADATGVLQAGATLSTVDTLTCNHPLHLAPTLVQIDRHSAGKYTGHIYIAQLTNSPFDPVTMDVSANFPASQMIIRKDVAASGSAVTPDVNWGPSAGRMVLSVTNSSQICGEWNNVTQTCTVPMPTAARPSASSTGIIAGDLESFALVTTWYVPTSGCVKGKAYVTVHRVYPNETVSQIHGERLPDEPVVGAVFAGGSLVVATSTGPRKIVPAGLGVIEHLPSQSGTGMSVVDRYRRMGWIELP
jgi:hypothetical protein